jgi:Na+-transporting methylmalonyl-CoA/oxaloacetate decarboxylase gamma subunit
MSNWHEPLIFLLILISFVMGMSSIIMGFFAQPAETATMKTKVEYGFFGLTGLVLCALFSYALATA